MPRVGSDPRNGSWERQFESGLPDCRVKYLDRDQQRVMFRGQLLDTVYCADCGKPAMGVNPDCPHVFYWCDECFYGKHGGRPPMGAVQIPEF